jgi:hypothetical protein
MRLFISGIAGCGKTTFARWLSDAQGYIRCPSGEEPVPGTFFGEIEAAIASERSVVIDWGFLSYAFDYVDHLIALGFEFWWCDGDRQAAARVFYERVGHPASNEDHDVYMRSVVEHWDWYEARMADRRLDVIGPGPTFMSVEDRWAVISSHPRTADS